MNYLNVRAEIKAQLLAAGIPIVFPYRRYAADWATFLNLFKDPATSRINVAWFSRMANDESVAGGDASTDAAGDILVTATNEAWDIELIYGFHDAEETDGPSETAFQLQVQAVEDQFRFLQDLGGKVFQNLPVKLLSADLRQFGDVLCHRALFRLIIEQRILEP